MLFAGASVHLSAGNFIGCSVAVLFQNRQCWGGSRVLLWGVGRG